MENNLQTQVDLLGKEVKRLKKRLARGRQIESVLRQSERHYRAIFDQASVGLAQVTREGKFLAVNVPFCKLVGYSREELLGKSSFDITWPDDRAVDTRIRSDLLAGRVPAVRYEKRYVHKNGAPIWVILNLSSALAGDGTTPCLQMAVDNISERRALQESLRRIASDLAKTDALAPMGTWKWNLRTGHVTASVDVLELYSLRKNGRAVPFSAILDRIHPQDREAVEEALRQARITQKPFQLEHRVLSPDGMQRLFSLNGEVYRRDAQGRPAVLIGMVQDITARRHAEAALQVSERRFRALFDDAADGIFTADEDGEFTDVNMSAGRMLGYTRDELIGMRIADLLAVEDLGRLEQSREYFLQSADHMQVAEWRLKRKDGTYLDTELSARILPDGRWMAIARDISDRKRTQASLQNYAREIHDLYDNAPCGYHSVDRNDVFVRVNNTELQWLAYRREELVGRKHFADLLSAECRHTYLRHLEEFQRSGRLRDVELDLTRKDGSLLPVLLSASATLDESGTYVASRATLFDITDLAEANRKLRQAATVFEHTRDAILITDGGGNIVAVNKAFSDITGYRPDEVIGKNPRLLKSQRQDQEFYRQMWGALEATGNWQGEIWDRKKSGDTFPTWQNITAVRDSAGNITEYISVFSDITTIKNTEQRLLTLAYHDPLTGLPNRLLFSDRLDRAIEHAKRHKSKVALLMLDLDRFKLINDTLGHAAGDQLLQVIAGRLNDSIRAEDTIARLGGDEFAIVTGNLDNIDDAAMLAQKIVNTVCEPLVLDGQTLNVSASIGIGIYPDDAQDQETLAKSADIAMYGAKDSGRNSYAFYTPAMTDRAAEVLLIDHGLRHAILHDELVLFYQPQISLTTGRIVGIEVLLRWNHPDKGMQQPDRFIPVAEETHLIESLGEWVLDNVCRQMERWSAAGIPPIRVAINLSARQLKRLHFVDDMRARIAACKVLEGFSFDLEVAETALQTDPGIVQALRELKSMGFRIVIDDFGTGYSSLHSLKHLPVDILKIDRGFVHGIPRDGDDRAITSAIIALGHSLGMGVVAEGIETKEQLRFLQGQHCDDAQGFLFYNPMPADECTHFLAASRVFPLSETPLS